MGVKNRPINVLPVNSSASNTTIDIRPAKPYTGSRFSPSVTGVGLVSVFSRDGVSTLISLFMDASFEFASLLPASSGSWLNERLAEHQVYDN
jgi:hypothetical protein